MNKLEELIQAVEDGVKDAKEDFPELGDHDLYHEIIHSVCVGHSLAMLNDVRAHFGFDRLRVR